MTFVDAFADELEKMAARGGQSAKLLSLLRVEGKNPYTAQAMRAIGKAKSPGGLPRGTPEAREAAKTIRALKGRTEIGHPGRYEQILNRQLGLPHEMRRVTKRR